MKAVTAMSRLSQFCLPLLLAVACDGDRPPTDLSLLPGKVQDAERDAESERLHKMQRITVLIDGVPEAMDDSKLQDDVGGACTATLACDTPVDPDGSYCAEPCET